MTNYPNQPVFEYQKEEFESAQKEYKKALNRSWIQRKKGVPDDWIQAPLMLITFGIWIALVVTWLFKDAPASYYTISSLIVAAIIGYAPEFLYGSKTITTRHALKKYPKLREVIRAFQEPGEKFRSHLPMLIVDGKKYFMVNYYRPSETKKYGYQRRIGIVFVNESMQVVENNELFNKVFLVENLSFLTGLAERLKDYRYIRDKYVITNALKKSEKILLRFKKRFYEQGVGIMYDKLMPSFPVLHGAVGESGSMNLVHEKIRKALGYSFATEFLYEDAVQLDEIRQAFIGFMNTAYKLPLQRVEVNVAALTVSIITERKRSDRKVLFALEKVRIIKNGISSIVDRFEREGVIQDEEWEYYHRKVDLARKLGWQIAKD